MYTDSKYTQSDYSLLPTGEKMNPSKPQDAYYYDERQVAVIVKSEKGTYRVLTTFGSGMNFVLGYKMSIRHDQTWNRLGVFTIVGAVSYETGEVIGDVPNKNLTHWVFK